MRRMLHNASLKGTLYEAIECGTSKLKSCRIVKQRFFTSTFFIRFPELSTGPHSLQCSILETTLGELIERKIQWEQCRTRSGCFCDIEQRSRAGGGPSSLDSRGIQPGGRPSRGDTTYSAGLTVHWSRRIGQPS